MRYLICLSAFLLVSSCSPAAPPVPAPKAKPVAPAKPTPRAVTPPRLTRQVVSGITFEGVTFDSTSHRLVVEDQADGPGTRYADAVAAARGRGGIAAVNAGFFTPEGDPLGLVVAAGKSTGAWNSASSLGSGVWYDINGPAISRREKLGRVPALKSRELIQAGPMLVENGASIGGLEGTKASARTVILWDGGTRWWIGIGSPCTLSDLTTALAGGSPAGWPIRYALNLDGGRSSDLYVSANVPGGPVTRRPSWNRSVRNFLILLPRG